jgi:hypothetical protein
MDYTQVGGLTIWVSTRRMHIHYHNVTSPGGTTTDCGRSTRTGLIAAPDELIDMWARPCPRCWPTDPTAV